MGRLDAATNLTAHSRHLEETAKLTMFAAGLRSDDWVLAAGADWVADQVVAGRRDLGLDASQYAVSTRALRSGSTRTIVSIATLTPDRLAAQAAYAIDWLDRFDLARCLHNGGPKRHAVIIIDEQHRKAGQDAAMG